ncbi:MAG: hypothetical protein EAZ60_06625 [Oscillatoriales cyanobacterium]|nr:MAG: hypothetical protein EAZ83_01980 [Oscillatoriales cyanobacterium]TAE98393.1 MAG: hypothetical protein EAZ79_07600 [Oscillatoriales cyanobacterium]TAF23305.1 MAG: hypothetical protein EAZ73_02320 [Oscillatoriales cyanobacterium]TAF35579.1 MAG: hypothetical protein EAZ69_12605 [Oscillatoriales cyanobacterium]TAF57576.1 MAG: hypothetical protein EAZ60_06625 [Oscillatoriales cyanobacterium]
MFTARLIVEKHNLDFRLDLKVYHKFQSPLDRSHKPTLSLTSRWSKISWAAKKTICAIGFHEKTAAIQNYRNSWASVWHNQDKKDGEVSG